MMKANKNEQDFVLRYFRQGKIDTRKAWRKVVSRADEEAGVMVTTANFGSKAKWTYRLR